MINLNLNKRIVFALSFMLFFMASGFSQYCIPVYTTGTGFGDYCSYVGIGDISNTTDGAPSPFYSDYTALSTDLTIGLTYTITVTSGSYSSNNDFGVWVDYNSDDDFYDADELVGTVQDLGAFTSGTITFSVPYGAIGGSTVLRVREIYVMPDVPDPCGSYSYGETEDYGVNLMAAAAIDGGITDITAPTVGVGLGVEAVSVVIQNFGSDPISGFNVSYTVDGGAAIIETYPGTIAAYTSASYTFATTYDFTAPGCYSILAYTSIADDATEANNDITVEVCNLEVGIGKMYIYSNTTGGEPWFTTANTTAMNTAFGVEGIDWTRSYFETVDPAVAFSAVNCFVFLEGSDSHAQNLEDFLTVNIDIIEDWVNSGGHLLLNSAPNEGDGMSFGFGGTSLVYDGGSGTVTAADPGHPIFSGPFTPVVLDYTGSNFSHARITGVDISTVIKETGTTDITLGEKSWGLGTVMFGGMTTNNFHSPLIEAANLRANILAYLGSCAPIVVCEVPSGLSVDGITTDDAVLHWNEVVGADQYRVSLQNVATGLIKTKGYYTNSVEIINKLAPLTDYAFRVKTVCYDDLGTISDPSPWYYFTTLGRIGENSNASVMLFPNPNTGIFTLNVNGYENNQFELNVFNSIGQIVYTKSIVIDNTSFVEQININNVAPGMYQISLRNSDTNLNYSVVVTE